MSRLRLGTRASALALAQAGWIDARLPGEVEVVTVTTAGDVDRSAGDKSRWVGGLEAALRRGEIDLAVHSAKDVPSELADGCVLVGAPERADARDVLCGAPSLEALAPGARVGTSALRRRAQLLAVRPDLDVVDLRGNVDTRLRKLDAGDVDALVLAAAGLERLERSDAIGARLDPDRFVPASGQGTLALEAREGDAAAAEAAADILDAVAWESLRVERALVAGLEAGCNTPVGAFARPDGGGVRVTAFAGLPDGSAWIVDELDGPAGDPETLGREVAGRMLAAGAGELLARAEAIGARA